MSLNSFTFNDHSFIASVGTDFFDDEQLFLILEFEFGGSDLENINGKVLTHRTGFHIYTGLSIPGIL